MVTGVGDAGCGYEASLEAWYRFLVDPEPYESIAIENDQAVLVGRDELLLAQRRQFLRPDSLLAIVMLTDENDCSIRDGGQFYFAAQTHVPGTTTPYHLPKPRAACSSGDASLFEQCCRSCGQGPGQGCDSSGDDCVGALAAGDDHANLRCYDQKRRFGIDFLHPIERYVSGLTQAQVEDRYGNVVPNPLFFDLIPEDDNSMTRNPGMVFLAGVVGVPWQDIARRNEHGEPDLLAGIDATGVPSGGFQSSFELVANGTWATILGHPSCYPFDAGCLPGDPHMIESIDPRAGLPTAAAPLSDPIHGHEHAAAMRDDLQYACTFDLPVPRDCTATHGSCDCDAVHNDDPLCCDPGAPSSCAYDPQAPASGFGTMQYGAKAYPGIRHLQVLEGIGYQALVGSICPAQIADPSRRDFGYRPAIAAVTERLQVAACGSCLPHVLLADADGRVACRVLEARRVSNCEAACAKPGRRPVDPNDCMVEAARADPLAATGDWSCFCEIVQPDGEELAACQYDPREQPLTADGEPVFGWCYIDTNAVPAVGNPEIVSDCPEDEKRDLRIVGDSLPASGATVFMSCTGE
jgi:hypothetical protein